MVTRHIGEEHQLSEGIHFSSKDPSLSHSHVFKATWMLKPSELGLVYGEKRARTEKWGQRQGSLPTTMSAFVRNTRLKR